jgi:uncharacterized surface protein with fasciclin (FAS1) repeats
MILSEGERHMSDRRRKTRSRTMFHMQAGRIAGGALALLLVSAAANAATAKDVASTLASNPRFSDYVSALKDVGLWHVLEHEKNVTIFAPTNEAFAALGRNWRENLAPTRLQDIQNPTMFRTEQETYLEGVEVRGTYPEDQFRGKVTHVKAASGYFFTVDGTQPGRLLINPQTPYTIATIGFVPVEHRTVTAGAPIAANNGFIYPTDGFAATYDAEP